MEVNKIRYYFLMIGEWMDAWRITPRVLVAGYGYLLYKIVTWYMLLTPYMLEGCVSDNVKLCIIQAPTIQHTALLTAFIGVSAAIFAFYTKTGRNWGNGVNRWDVKSDPRTIMKSSDSDGFSGE
jgi:hypothetical protein